MSCAQSALCTASLAAQSSDSEPRSSSTRAGMRDSKHIDASGDAKTLVAPHVFCFFILRTFLTRLPFFFGLSKQELRTPTSKQSVRVVPSGQTHQISPPTSRSTMSRLTLMSVARSLPGNEVLVDKSNRALETLRERSTSGSSNGGKNSKGSDKRREADKVDLPDPPQSRAMLSGSKRS